jgi:hypothetical protein
MLVQMRRLIGLLLALLPVSATAQVYNPPNALVPGGALFTLGSTSVTYGGTVTTVSNLTLVAPVLGVATGTSLVYSGTAPNPSAGQVSIGGSSANPTLGANGEGVIFTSASAGTGLFIAGKGSTNDLFIGNSALGQVIRVPTGTTNMIGTGTLTGLTGFTSGGTITLSGVTTGTNADFACFAAGGVMTLQTSACTISSMRFKNLIGQQSIDNALADVLGLNPIAFTMKPGEAPNADWNYDKPQIGLSAENVAAVNPKCAIYEQDGKTPKSYRQECVIAELVGAVRALKADNDSLRAEMRGRR